MPNDILEGATSLRDPRKSALGFSLPETQSRQRLKGLRMCIGNCCADSAAVRRAVSMDDVQLRSRARENEPAFVDGSVMRAAQRDEILDVVAAVLRPKLDVMHVREHRV
ncbi:MAG TPA: hypothetical protein VFV94_13640, partial [Polyangiaceae bacterium]|nr:hypothetical protein [Polyangiaceae bacterium]